jgi:hypothetical protein
MSSDVYRAPAWRLDGAVTGGQHGAAQHRQEQHPSSAPPGSFFSSRFAPWQIVTAAMLLASALPEAALGAAGVSSPYFCSRARGRGSNHKRARGSSQTSISEQEGARQK